MIVKSQDDLNKPETHSTEVLLEAISKLETTTKELAKVKKQLEITVVLWACCQMSVILFFMTTGCI